jgi:hypothetical protein
VLWACQIHVHFTLTWASWLNLVEPWFATLTEKTTPLEQLPLHPELETAIRDDLQPHNAVPRLFVWTKSAHQILDSIARCYQRTNDSGH